MNETMRLSPNWTPPAPAPGMTMRLSGPEVEKIMDTLEPLRLYLGLLSKSIGFSAPMDEVAFVGLELLTRATDEIEEMRC